MSDIKILVAMHKNYWAPKDNVYVPIHVGAHGKSTDWQCVRDDSGDNISEKNPFFCELTGLYWAWKNLDCEYIGLCHYRRYFAKKFLGMSVHILGRCDYEKVMQNYDVLLPNPTVHTTSVYAQYADKHKEKDLQLTGEIIKELYPEYYEDFRSVMFGHIMYTFNMFLQKKCTFDEYCSWLFSILFELEKRIDIREYDDYQKRVFGFIAERLMAVFIRHKDMKVAYSDVLFLGKRRKFQIWLQRKWGG